jgi:hypothetical protein
VITRGKRLRSPAPAEGGVDAPVTALWFWEVAPPAIVLRPPLFADENRFPGAKVSATYAIYPPLVLDAKVVALQRALDRRAGAETRRAQGRLPDAAQTVIDELLARHPDISSSWIAGRMQGDPATAVPRLRHGNPVLDEHGLPVPLTVPVLARKITRYRR